MAKGNLLLGTAGNSVGDVVMYRREGAQVSRVRVRKIKNPKTDAQSLQRAVFSPVAKFYSPLAVVLERSFEGLSKMKSYNKFLKTNIDLARANGWLLPKGTGFFPLPYQLSKGTLQVANYAISNNELAFTLSLSSTPQAPADTMGQLSQMLIDSGYNAGDIVTVIVITRDADNNYVPKAIQFEIDTTSSVPTSSGISGISFNPESSDLKTVNITYGSQSIVAGAVIIARFENDKWRRSTQSVAVATAVMTEIGTDAYKAAAIASYGMNAGDPNPLVYLDGDTLEG